MFIKVNREKVVNKAVKNKLKYLFQNYQHPEDIIISNQPLKEIIENNTRKYINRKLNLQNQNICYLPQKNKKQIFEYLSFITI